MANTIKYKFEEYELKEHVSFGTYSDRKKANISRAIYRYKINNPKCKKVFKPYNTNECYLVRIK